MNEILRCKNKEKHLKKLENKKRNTLNMISYFEEELKKMQNKSTQDSFPNKEQYNRYLENLQKNLLKQHNILIEITKEIEVLKNNKS